MRATIAEILRTILPILPLLILMIGSGSGLMDINDSFATGLFLCMAILCMWISVAYDRRNK